MKVLKPGKVEQRKFVCVQCGCEFTAMPDDCEFALPNTLHCPQKGCDGFVGWDAGKLYEEPAPKQTEKEIQKLAKITEEFLNDNVRISYSEMDLVCFAKYLISNGVTFRE